MDKRKTKDLLHIGEKVSPAYFHEQSRLRKRLDEYQEEQEKRLRKISNSQETLVSAFATQQTSKPHITEAFKTERRRSSAVLELDSGNPENMEIYRTQLRMLSIASDTRYRKLSYPMEGKKEKKATRQLSDPLEFSSQASLESKIIAFPRRKLTTGQIDAAVSSKEFHLNSVRTDILKSDLSKNQNTTRTTLLRPKLPNQQVNEVYKTSLSRLNSEPGHSKINLPTRLFSSPNTPSRMFNETSNGEQSKHVEDSLKNPPNKLLCHRVKTAIGDFPSFQGLPSVLSENMEQRKRKTQNFIHNISPGPSVITKGQFEDTEVKAEKVHHSGESPTESESSVLIHCSSELNLNTSRGSENDSGKSYKSAFRKLSLSSDMKSKRHLHELSNATSAAGALKGVRCLGNAWGETSTARRKISTVEAPEGIVINEHSSSLNKQIGSEPNSSSDRERNFDALQNFRRLALAAVATKRFSANNLNSSSENHKNVVPRRKKSSKARLEDLQRPTESYLRQIVAEETSSKTPLFRTRSSSMNRANARTTTASGITKIRRISQAAMATQILIDRQNRKVAGSGISDSESRKIANQGKTLAEMMDELKDCRYLRNSTADDD